MVIMSGPRFVLTPSVLVVTVLSLLSVNLVLGEIKNKGWWNRTVFYQIYPLTFKDSNGDGIGDINGIIEKLDHFVDIGIGGVWLSPIFPSPMVDGGYDIEDFKDIHQDLGTLTDFQNLVKEAKKRGLKVLLDLVPNHTSDKHIWFQYSLQQKGKYADYYIWKNKPNNGDGLPNNWVSVFDGSMWECMKTSESSEEQRCYLHQFHAAQPDLNYRNEEVKKEMKAIIEYWLKQGVDGFRVDAVPHIYEDKHFTDNPKKVDKPALVYTDFEPVYTKDLNETYELMHSWRQVLDDYADKNDDSEKILLIEAYASLNNMIKYYHYGGIPFQFQLITDLNQNSKAEDFHRVITEWMKHLPSGAVTSWVIGNHDRNRTASRFPDRGDQMTMLAMVLPGIAVTYNGEELGMRDYTKITMAQGKDEQAKASKNENIFKWKTRDVCRTPMQWTNESNAGFSSAAADKLWLPINADDYKTINLATESATRKANPYNVYKSLTQLRNSSEALQNGVLNVTLYGKNKVLAVKRIGAEKSITLLINFDNEQAVTVDLSNYLAGEPKILIVSSNTEAIKANEVVKDLKKVHIPAKAAYILESPNNGVATMLSNFSLIALFQCMSH